MAERTLFGLRRVNPTAEARRREEQFERRNLRIAIRQLERAELYLDAIESLNLSDREVDVTVADVSSRLRALRQYLAQRRSRAG
jgi:hypothetical protein